MIVMTVAWNLPFEVEQSSNNSPGRRWISEAHASIAMRIAECQDYLIGQSLGY